MNSKMIGECKNCGEIYCMECSDAHEYAAYCSRECENEITTSNQGINQPT